MTTHHQDKDGKALHVGDLIHFTIDGRPYSGVIHSLVRRDHEPAIMTIVQLFLPATKVSKEAPHNPQSKSPELPHNPQSKSPEHSNQQEPKSAEANRGTTKAEPPKKGTH